MNATCHHLRREPVCHACASDAEAELVDPLAELHMEDYDTDEEGEEMKTETASRLFGSGNPGMCCPRHHLPHQQAQDWHCSARLRSHIISLVVCACLQKGNIC